MAISQMGASPPVTHSFLCSETVEKKSEEGLGVTGTVWQGLRDRGLIWSQGREAPMPLSGSGRGEGETLKKELKNCVSYKAWVSGWPVNHWKLES